MDRGHLFRFNLGSQLSSKSQVEIWGPGNKITAPRNSPAHKRTQQAMYRTSGPHHLLGVLYCLGVLRYSEESFLKASTVRSVNPAQGYRVLKGLGCGSPSSSSAWPHSFWASCSRGLAAELRLELQRPLRVPETQRVRLHVNHPSAPEAEVGGSPAGVQPKPQEEMVSKDDSQA